MHIVKLISRVDIGPLRRYTVHHGCQDTCKVNLNGTVICMSKVGAFLKRKDIEISLKRYGIDALGAMAQGLFCSLLIGTILNTLGSQTGVEIFTTVGGYASAMSGPAMAVAIIAAELGKVVSKETPIDILVTPLVTIFSGVALAALIAPPIGTGARYVGSLIELATVLQPFWMGIIVSALVGIALTLPISSAAICSVLGLTGLAGGAAVAGCCANMVGFAVMSFRENRWGGLVSQGLGTSMLQMGNIVRNPKIWIPAIVTSMITGPIATCVFKMEMNGDAINSGMGTCGLCGPLGVWTGWLNPTEAAVAKGAAAIDPTWFDYLGLVLICFVLPAVICWALGLLCRKIGWIKEGDLKLN